MHTIAHLKAQLKAKGVKGYSGKNKAALTAMCESHKCMPKPLSKKKAMDAAFSELHAAQKVLAEPEKHDMKSRKRAQAIVNFRTLRHQEYK
jgi:hypothetical protein